MQAVREARGRDHDQLKRGPSDPVPVPWDPFLPEEFGLRHRGKTGPQGRVQGFLHREFDRSGFEFRNALTPPHTPNSALTETATRNLKETSATTAHKGIGKSQRGSNRLCLPPLLPHVPLGPKASLQPADLRDMSFNLG